MLASTLPPPTVRAATARQVWAFGARIAILEAGDGTAGALGVIDEWMPPGFATPYHLHRAEDEAFYVLEGEMTFVVDGRAIPARPGSYLAGPRDVPHGFRVEGDRPARILLFSTPSSFIDFTLAVGETALDPEAPPPPADVEKLVRLAPAFGIELLGPLPV